MKNFDPYQEPSDEELEASGAKSWFKDSIASQNKANAKLKSSFSQDTRSIKNQNKDLQNLLELPPELSSEASAPDLFASERDQVNKENSSLPSFLDDLKTSQAADKDLLKNMFDK